jgi:hypothetical protein
MPGKPEQERKNHNDSPRNDEAGGQEEIGRPREIGGPKGPEPTRYGDWQRAGRCIDF